MLSIKSFSDKDEIKISQTLFIEKINGEVNAYEAIGEFIVFKNAKRDRCREKLNLSMSINQQI